MKLNFRKYGSGHPLLILHGVFGSADNWQTLGKEFSEKFTVYLIDLRNHGNSPHDPGMDYDLMSADLDELAESEDLSSVYVLGHSMGGKAAMHFACDHPERVDKLVAVDISPQAYAPHHQHIFEGFHSINLSELESRKEADHRLAEKISDFGVRQFMLKSLTRDDSGAFSWKINLEAIERNIDKIGEAIPAQKTFDKPALFIAGSQSRYITEDSHEVIRSHFPSARIETIEGAGHWVHADKPKELEELVVKFLL